MDKHVHFRRRLGPKSRVPGHEKRTLSEFRESPEGGLSKSQKRQLRPRTKESGLCRPSVRRAHQLFRFYFRPPRCKGKAAKNRHIRAIPSRNDEERRLSSNFLNPILA